MNRRGMNLSIIAADWRERIAGSDEERGSIPSQPPSHEGRGCFVWNKRNAMLPCFLKVETIAWNFLQPFHKINRPLQHTALPGFLAADGLENHFPIQNATQRLGNFRHGQLVACDINILGVKLLRMLKSRAGKFGRILPGIQFSIFGYPSAIMKGWSSPERKQFRSRI